MVSIQVKSIVSSVYTKSVSQQTMGMGQAGNKIRRSHHSDVDKLLDFSARIQTGTLQNLNDQNAIFHFNQLDPKLKDQLRYNDKSISELSQEEAVELVAEDGYFGIAKTSQRIFDFVLAGAGDDSERLKAGREGILQGFAEAEKAWGGRLPGLSYKTLEESLEAIDEKIRENGGSIVDLST